MSSGVGWYQKNGDLFQEGNEASPQGQQPYNQSFLKLLRSEELTYFHIVCLYLNVTPQKGEN